MVSTDDILRLTEKYHLTPKQIRTLVKMAGGEDAVRKADAVTGAVRRVPGSKTTRLSVNSGDSLGRISHIQRALNALRGRTINVTTVYRETKASRLDALDNAAGGIYRDGIRTFAGGGMWGSSPDHRNGHVAHMAKGGTYRVFAEDETQGESYIPHANDWRRPRARQIAAETVGILGGVAFFASGGTKRNRFTASEYRGAARGFDLNGTLSTAEVRRELRSFASEVRKAGGSVGKNFGKLSRQAEAAATRLAAGQAKLESLQSRQSDYRTTAAGSFSNTPWGGTLADWVTQNEANRNDSNRMTAISAALQKRGFKGDFISQLTGSGNLALAEQFAASSPTQLRGYQSLFNATTKAQDNLGAQAARAMTDAVRAQTAINTQLIRRLNTLEGAVERGAARGVSKDTQKSQAKGKSK